MNSENSFFRVKPHQIPKFHQILTKYLSNEWSFTQFQICLVTQMTASRDFKWNHGSIRILGPSSKLNKVHVKGSNQISEKFLESKRPLNELKFDPKTWSKIKMSHQFQLIHRAVFLDWVNFSNFSKFLPNFKARWFQKSSIIAPCGGTSWHTKNPQGPKIPFAGPSLTKVNLRAQIWSNFRSNRPKNLHSTITNLFQPFGNSWKRFRGKLKTFET